MAAIRTLILACTLATAACAPSTPRPERAERTEPGARASCLDPSRARSYAVLRGEETLLVDAGSDHYRLEIEPSCRGVDFSFALKFRGDPVSGRVCGFTDAIVTDRGDCRIHRVDWITREEYDRLIDEDKHPRPRAEGDKSR